MHQFFLKSRTTYKVRWLHTRYTRTCKQIDIRISALPTAAAPKSPHLREVPCIVSRAEPDLAQPAVSRFCHFVRSTIFSMEVVYIVAVVAVLLFGALGIWVLSPSNDADASRDATMESGSGSTPKGRKRTSDAANAAYAYSYHEAKNLRSCPKCKWIIFNVFKQFLEEKVQWINEKVFEKNEKIFVQRFSKKLQFSCFSEFFQFFRRMF